MNKIDTIEWHEECLKNQKNYLNKLELERKSLVYRINDLTKDMNLLEYQISEAKKIGKNKFDRDRFRVKKGNRNE